MCTHFAVGYLNVCAALSTDEASPAFYACQMAAGMMELSYTQHYSSSSEQSHGTAAGNSSSSSSSSNEAVDITFTATTSASGSLLIGEVDRPQCNQPQG